MFRSGTQTNKQTTCLGQGHKQTKNKQTNKQTRKRKIIEIYKGKLITCRRKFLHCKMVFISRKNGRDLLYVV